MINTTITFIGGGNMARSIIGGLIKNDFLPKNLHVIEPNSNTANNIAKDFGVSVYSEVSAELMQVDYLLIAVKPQIFHAVCKSIGSAWTNTTASIISIAAGIRTESIRTWVKVYRDAQLNIIRVMPNTPALIGMGACGIYTNNILNDANKTTITNIFTAIGECVWLQTEDQLDTVTALSGSGPAYFFTMFEALIAAGISQGLSQEQSEKLVIQTALGATQMAKNIISVGANGGIEKLRESVTSKGGTTAAGLESLHKNDFTKIIKQAVHDAKQRSQELSNECGS